MGDHTREQLVQENAELGQQLATCRETLRRKVEDCHEMKAQLQAHMESRTDQLRERSKELECLYSLSRLVEQPDTSLEDILQGLVTIIPPAWQDPAHTGARLTYEDQVYTSPNYQATPWRQVSPLIVHDRQVGEITVCYQDQGRSEDETPFLPEEQDLLDALAERTGRIIERMKAQAILRESERRFRRAILDAPFPIMIHAEDGQVVQINQVWTEITGYAPDDIPTLAAWTEKAYGTRMRIVKEEIEHLYALDQRKKEGKYEITTRAGDTRIWDFSSAPLGQLSDGRRLVISMAMDVTEREQATAALERTNTQIANILESISDGFFALESEKLIVTYFNSAAERLLGRPAEEVLGCPLLEAFPEAQGSIFETQYTKALREHKTLHFETYFGIAPYENWYDVRVYPYQDGISVYFQVTTARKEAEQALHRVNRSLRVLTECNQALIRIRDEDALLEEVCHILVDFGEYQMAWVGFAQDDAAKTVTPAAFAGEDMAYLDDILITWADDVNGRGPTGTAIRTGEPSIMRDIPNAPSYAPWRQAATQRGFAASIALPLKAEDRMMGALNLYTSNPTAFDNAQELRLLEELADDLAYGILALRTRSEMEALTRIVNASPAVAFLWEASEGWPVAYVSENVRQFGYTPEDFYDAGLQYTDVIYPQDQVRVIEEVQRYTQAGTDQFTQEYRILTKAGEVRWLDDRTWVQRDPAGVVTHYQGVVLDITRRKEVEAELQTYTEALETKVSEKVRELEMARAKVIQTAKLASLGEMATGVAHELNQPLTSMLFDADYLQTLAEQTLDGQAQEDEDLSSPMREVHEIGQHLVQDIQRCRRITDYLRDFKHITRGAATSVDLNRVIEDSFILVSARLMEENVAVDRHLAPDLPMVRANPGQLEQVFLNLINNAEDALKEMTRRVREGEVTRPQYQKRLEISTRREGETVVAQVRDNGCGIAAADRPHIFEPFFTTKPEDEAGGLGLAISQGIVAEFGGEITFESAENEGTTFTLRLPAIPT
jgi:PAS domain S-box-containing protein